MSSFQSVECALKEPGGVSEEASLLRAARDGDLAAFEQLLIRHQRRVYLTALRLLGRHEDAQDAAQEVFLRLHKHLSRLDEKRDLAPWLYRVTVNVCRDTQAKRGPRLQAEPEWEPVAGAAGDPHATATAAEQRKILAAALRRLSPKERAAVVLRDLEGLTTREVAQILGAAEVTVRSHLSAARLKLRSFTERFRRGRL